MLCVQLKLVEMQIDRVKSMADKGVRRGVSQAGVFRYVGPIVKLARLKRKGIIFAELNEYCILIFVSYIF